MFNRLMYAIITMAVICTGCETTAPAADACVEFDRATIHAGRPVVCRMVWCESGQGFSGAHSSGLAALWCDDVNPPKPAQE